MQPQQTTNNTQRLMKRRSNGTHHQPCLFFSHPFVERHDNYAAVMAKYGLHRGIRGSEARHTTTAQYYRDLKRQTGELEANVRQLQTEHQRAERQLMELQAKHRREMADKETEHQKEVSFLKSIIQKAKKWFPLFQELVYMEKFCLKVGFNERQTATLISSKPLFYKGELYSEEYKRKFTTERAGFQVVKDPKDRSKLALAINGQPIGEWFKEQSGRLFSSIRRAVEPLRRSKGMGL